MGFVFSQVRLSALRKSSKPSSLALTLGSSTQATTMARIRPLGQMIVRRIQCFLRAHCFLFLFAVLSTPGTSSANPVFDWTELMIDAIRLDNSGPTLSSRNLAILHTSVFDAVNSVTPTYQPYFFHTVPPSPVFAEAAAAGAAHLLIKHLYPGVAARADQMLANFQALHSATPGLATGLQVGQSAATAILQLRQSDGASTDVPYIPSSDPGMWRRTGPFFRPPVAPHWRYVDFFGLFDMDDFLPGPPPALSSAEYAVAYNQVKSLGAANNSTRTEEQTQVAHFWSDFSYTSMPPGHWHLIAINILRARAHSLLDTARLFALLSMAQADAATVCWEAKYRYNLWRPVTAIQRGNEDENEATVIDPEWQSLLAAPPFPSFTSGHSTFSAASGAVLRSFYGTDEVPFTATADALPGVTRAFTNLTQCVDEIGMSRIYGGIHFSFDNVAGKKCGRKIGEFVSANYLLPLDTLPKVVINNLADPAVRVHASQGVTVITDVSDDLVNWRPVSTNLAVTGGVEIRNIIPASSRFFRARQL